jgi:hypothetical protein
MNEMRPPRAKARRDNIEAIARRYDRVALVLPGGGALGAYQSAPSVGEPCPLPLKILVDYELFLAGRALGSVSGFSSATFVMPLLQHPDAKIDNHIS